jgi:acetolactate synthase-1/2/3 large subunit
MAGEPGRAAVGLLDLGEPPIDRVALAQGLGLAAVRCADAEGFDDAFAGAMTATGPMPIEVVLA